MKKRLVVLLIAALAVVAVVAGTVLANSEPTTGRALWESHDITSYRFVLERNCFCLIRGPVVIEVRDGTVVSVVDQETGEATVDGFALSEIFSEADTIEKLFELIEDSQDAAVLQVSYDETLGYPTEVYVDQSEMMADEEIGYVVHELEVLE